MSEHITKSDVFISYASEDIALATSLQAHLEERDVVVWRDDKLKLGSGFEDEIQKQLENSRMCVFLMSGASLMSEYCQNEIGFAVAKRVPVIPIRLDDCTPSGFLASRTYLDVSEQLAQLKTVVPCDVDSDADSIDDVWPFHVFLPLHKRLEDLRQNDVRPALLYFYRRMMAMSAVTSKTDVLISIYGPQDRSRGLHNYHDRFTRKDVSVSSAAALRACADIVSYLEGDDSLVDLYPLVSNYQQREETERFRYLPGWLMDSDGSGDLDASTVFQPIPNVIVRVDEPHYYAEREEVLDAFVHLPVIRRSKRSEEPIVPHADDHAPRRVYALGCDVAYSDLVISDVNDLRWTPASGGVTQLYIPSKGVYRLSKAYLQMVGQHPRGTRLLLSRYLGPEESQMLLQGAPHTATRSPSDALQLRYLGLSGLGRRSVISFLLFNDTERIVVLTALRLIIHSVKRGSGRKPGGGFGGLPVHRFTVDLADRTGPTAIESAPLKYSPGEIDKFEIGFRSDAQKRNFEVSVSVDWMDVRTGVSRTLETPRELLIF